MTNNKTLADIKSNISRITKNIQMINELSKKTSLKHNKNDLKNMKIQKFCFINNFKDLYTQLSSIYGNDVTKVNYEEFIKTLNINLGDNCTCSPFSNGHNEQHVCCFHEYSNGIGDEIMRIKLQDTDGKVDIFSTLMNEYRNYKDITQNLRTNYDIYLGAIGFTIESYCSELSFIEKITNERLNIAIATQKTICEMIRQNFCDLIEGKTTQTYTDEQKEIAQELLPLFSPEYVYETRNSEGHNMDACYNTTQQAPMA